MDSSFWHARWNSGRIGFHNDHYHPLLTGHWNDVCPGPGTTVLVPLAGKSLDMRWLADRGHSVVGVELSEVAASDFFAEQQVTPEVQRLEDWVEYRHGRVRLLVADFFAVDVETVGRIDAVYDRAALIALPERMRAKYVAQWRRLAPDAPSLLITVEYDQSLRGGPPFSVEAAEVRRLFESHPVEELAAADSQLRDLPVVERAYRIGPAV